MWGISGRKMQYSRVFWKPSEFSRDLRGKTRYRVYPLRRENSLGLWWKRVLTATTMAYVLSTQTLHAVSGWSRLGVVFAALLSVLLGLGLNLESEPWEVDLRPCCLRNLLLAEELP